MMGDGCYCYCCCLLLARTHIQLSLFCSLSISAQKLHNSFRSYDDDDDDGKVAMGKKQQHERSSSCLLFWPLLPQTMVCMAFLVPSIIRNVCIHKMCYGLLFSTFIHTLTTYRSNAMQWYDIE